MTDYCYKKSFLFDNKTDGLAAVLDDCAVWIESQKDNFNITGSIISRARWAVNELLINGVKHAETSETILDLEIRMDVLTITKRDFGKPLKLSVSRTGKELIWPLQKLDQDQYFEIYRNGMDSLQVYTADSEHAVFLVKEAESMAMPLLLCSISEHFGLMIIAKAADRFSYTHDTKSGLNIFSVSFDMKR